LSLDSVLETGSVDILSLAIGFVYHIVLIGLLFHLFNKKY
jgi:hypothetical protein